MRDKIERYNTIANEVNELNPQVIIVGTDSDAELEAAKTIRSLRQIIERLRRIVDDEQPPIEVHSLQDAMKLSKDELAYLAWQFFRWININNICPADSCKEFPCQYRRAVENKYEDEYSEEDFQKYKKQGFDADKFCENDQQGCWAEYYLWCYRNGVNPLNGKKACDDSALPSK